MIGLPFEKLDEEQQKKAIDVCRYYNVEGNWWSDTVEEEFMHDMDIMYGVNVDPKGFSWRLHGQGSFAAFTGYLYDPDKFIEQFIVPEDYPELYRKIRWIFREHCSSFQATTTPLGGFQKGIIDGSISVNPHDPDTQFEFIWDEANRITGTRPIGKHAKAWQDMDDASKLAEEIWNEFCEKQAFVLFKALEAEYNYQTSDEVVTEYLLINEFLFAPKNNRVILI